MKITIGADPEVMFEKDGKYYSAINILNATKDKRKKIGKSYFYNDNVLAEFTIPPAKSKTEFVTSIGNALKSLSDFAPNYNVRACAAAYFDEDQLNCEEAYRISCDPETCVYELKVILPDDSLFRKLNLRTAGGHIHIGNKNLLEEEDNIIYCVKMMDLFLGTCSLFLDQEPASKLRKTFYGKAGRYRTPFYGVEYRSLSNFWLKSPELCKFVYDVSCFVTQFVKEKKHFKYWSVDTEALQNPDNWKNENFLPKNCHVCHGYDALGLVELIDKHDYENPMAEDFLNFIFKILPKDIVKNFKKLADLNIKDEIKKNWGFND